MTGIIIELLRKYPFPRAHYPYICTCKWLHESSTHFRYTSSVEWYHPIQNGHFYARNPVLVLDMAGNIRGDSRGRWGFSRDRCYDRLASAPYFRPSFTVDVQEQVSNSSKPTKPKFQTTSYSLPHPSNHQPGIWYYYSHGRSGRQRWRTAWHMP